MFLKYLILRILFFLDKIVRFSTFGRLSFNIIFGYSIESMSDNKKDKDSDKKEGEQAEPSSLVEENEEE